MTSQSPARDRLEWVDVAKGLCIVLVVLMHATLGVEKAVGAPSALNSFVMWAKPFRMPDFFLISGLFLAARITRPWAAYLDTKVLHFAYFYALWYTILYVVKGIWMSEAAAGEGLVSHYLWGYVEPYSSLWFIYLLAVMFVVAKLAEALPKLAVLALAALAHVLMPVTGSTVIDELASRFVFFYSGYILAPHVFAFARRAGDLPRALVAAGLVVWAVLNWLAVEDGIALSKGFDLPFSYAGIAAVVAFSALLAPLGPGRLLQYMGRNSLAVFLAFPLFIGPVRSLALSGYAGLPPEAAAIASCLAGIVGSLLLARLVAGTRLGFLFTRPHGLKLAHAPEALSVRQQERMGRISALARRREVL